MNARAPIECPNCGSSDFVEIGTKHQCTYCGTLMESPTPLTRAVIRCLRCGFDNEPGDSRCSKCGAVLSGWSTGEKKKVTPATASILVTVLGSMFIWIAGPVIGLILGYKALSDARTSGSLAEEKQARTAVIIGWLFIGLNLLFICLAFVSSGIEIGVGLCGGLIENLSSYFSGSLESLP